MDQVIAKAMEIEITERTAPEGIVFSSFDGEESLPGIMSLVERDLSEPYSVFTYRYFVLGWPELTILAREKTDNKLLGVIVCKADRVNRRKRLRGYIAMLAVDKEQRKRGIGSYLAYQAILKMREMKCDEVVLETELSNSGALSLYERLGFTRDKRLCRYYLNGGDAFRLKLWFSSPSWDDSQPTEAAAALLQDTDAMSEQPDQPNDAEAVVSGVVEQETSNTTEGKAKKPNKKKNKN